MNACLFLIALPFLIVLLILLVYLDFAIWYSAEMYNIWSKKKRKFRGILWFFWDAIYKEGK